QTPRRGGVGPATNQREPGPDEPQLLRQRQALAEDGGQFGRTPAVTADKRPPKARRQEAGRAHGSGGQGRAEAGGPPLHWGEQGGEERRVPDGDEGQVCRGQQTQERAVAERLQVRQAGGRGRYYQEPAEREARQRAEVRGVVVKSNRDAAGRAPWRAEGRG